MKSQRSLAKRAALALTLVLPASFTFLPATAMAATQPIRMTMFVGSPCFDGWATPESTVSYKWKDASGNVKGQAEVQTEGSGGLWYSVCEPPYSGPPIEPGDRFVVSDGHSTRRFTIPNLSIQLNRISDVIKGTAPAGTGVRLEYLYPAYPGWEILIDAKKLPVHANGQWSFDITRYNSIDGGDAAGVIWKSELEDRVFMFADAPYVVVTIGESDIAGLANHYATAHFQLKDGATSQEKGSSTVSLGLNQGIDGKFRDGNGDPVAVSAGDEVVSDVAPDASFIVPDIQVTTDAATDTVSGKCYDAGRFTQGVHISVYRQGVRRGLSYTGANPDGTFEDHVANRHTWPNPAVLKSGDRVLVQCFLVNGDIVQKWGDVL
jgi:hypothetical protein